MRSSHIVTLLSAGAVLLLSAAGHCQAVEVARSNLQDTVDAAIGPLMQEQGIPGMAIAITHNGKRHYFNYGVVSKDTGVAVTDKTLFEIGSVSKVFTATLAAYAEATGKLSFSAAASQYLPELRGSAFDDISVLDLGTYAAGGLPLQFPAGADYPDKMFDYFRTWKPTYSAGTHRLYSNPSIGLFGYLAARSMGRPFDELMEKILLPKLGLMHSYLRVPEDQRELYAQGYTKDDKPIRVGPGALDLQAYGMKTSSSDLIGFIEANIQPNAQDNAMQRAIATTQTGYYKVGGMTQALGWEFYSYPIELDALLAGNSSQMLYDSQPVAPIDSPRPEGDLLFNKTGSTNGFGSYVAFVPGKKVGIVMLANKSYPIPERVKAAHRILAALESQDAE